MLESPLRAYLKNAVEGYPGQNLIFKDAEQKYHTEANNI